MGARTRRAVRRVRGPARGSARASGATNLADTIVVPAASIGHVSAVGPGLLPPGRADDRRAAPPRSRRNLPRSQATPLRCDRNTERAPALGKRDRTPQRASGSAADPDRHAVLQRARVDGESAERVVLSGVHRLVARQCGPQRPQRVVAAVTAIVERRAEEVELLLEGAHPDAEDQPAAADVIQCAVALYDLQRVVVSRAPTSSSPAGFARCAPTT